MKNQRPTFFSPAQARKISKLMQAATNRKYTLEDDVLFLNGKRIERMTSTEKQALYAATCAVDEVMAEGFWECMFA